MASNKSGNDRYATLLTLLIWAMLGLLLLRWDWIDAAQRVTDAIPESINMREASSFARGVKIAWMMIGAMVVFRHGAKAASLLGFVNRGFLAFIVVVPLSILWSISPNETTTRFFTVVSIVVVGCAFAVAGWNPRRFQQVLRPFYTAVLVESLLIGIFLPDWISEAGLLKGAWHGVFESKNMFGQIAALGVVFWVHAWLYENAKWWRVVPFLAVSFICLVESRSSTSLLAAIFASLLMVLLHRLPPVMRRYMPYIVTLFAIAVLIYLGAVLQLIPGLETLFNPIATLTGKDATFSARSMIWQIVDHHRALSPIVGSGYGAYWIGPDPSSPSSEFMQKLFFYPWEAHNGYLEMANDLGYLGLAILFSFLAIFLRQCVTVFKANRPQAVLFIAIFFQQALTNLSESGWLVVTAPVAFITVTMAVFGLARMLMDQQRSPVRA